MDRQTKNSYYYEKMGECHVQQITEKRSAENS